ncbi:TauD/TfdA family dioxygenase [Streptomyces sp. NBC_00144]|uniref:TauD/TfdA dioxygenase family protein n=1 Tax=Streptomyces sp. NBC_00144 TaxID=2975665 RepID=UPI0032542159
MTAPRPSIKSEPLTCTIGAEVFGVNLGHVARDEALFAEMKALLLERKVLFFRDQDITRAEHVALAERFGALEDHPIVGSDPQYPGLVRIYKDENSQPEHYENIFHSDGSWRESPPMGAVLRCIDPPPLGGDTVWVDMVAAYADLPTHVKAQIDGLRARHSIEAAFGAALPMQKRHELKQRYPDAEHPVVRTHPETGETILFVNGGFTTHFVNYHTPNNVRHGVDFAPGANDLLNLLIRQATIPDHQVRWRWSKNSVAIWDNRSTQHYAVQDYWPAVRRMERAGIRGDRPF